MRCSDCDREDCPMLSLGDMPATREMSWGESKIAVDEHVRAVHSAHMDCNAHRVDWRARALAAEAQVAAAREALAPVRHASGCDALALRLCDCGAGDAKDAAIAAARRALGLEAA